MDQYGSKFEVAAVICLMMKAPRLAWADSVNVLMSALDPFRPLNGPSFLKDLKQK